MHLALNTELAYHGLGKILGSSGALGEACETRHPMPCASFTWPVLVFEFDILALGPCFQNDVINSIMLCLSTFYEYSCLSPKLQ